MTTDDTRADLAATLQARRDLGPEYDEALASGFLERLDRDIDARIEARLAGASRSGSDGALPLAIVSLALGVPLTAISAAVVGFLGLLLVWAGIVGVKVAYAQHRQPRR